MIPRYTDDPEPQHPIWVRPFAERQAKLSKAAHDDLVARLCRTLRA